MLRKPMPIRLTEESDERLQLKDHETGTYIEYMDLGISVERARKIAAWLIEAADWIESKNAQ